jgi:hypothetical protein
MLISLMPGDLRGSLPAFRRQRLWPPETGSPPEGTAGKFVYFVSPFLIEPRDGHEDHNEDNEHKDAGKQ